MDPIAYLNSFANFESNLHKIAPQDFNLNRVVELLDLLDNPHRKLKVIHVAGTKGKGSTAAFMASILQHAGYRVGLYTSPHLHKVNERIRVLDKENLKSKEQFPGSICDESLGFVLSQIRPHAAKITNEDGMLTYFEVLTVAAFLYFAKREVDIVILETGLGGRLDATNVVTSLVSVITPISLDHIKILGDNLTAIAKEKAGIIKHGQRYVVVAPQEQAAMDVIGARCQEFGIVPIAVHTGQVQDKHLALKGRHQMVNAACAIAVMGCLVKEGFRLSQGAIEAGLLSVKWAGRFDLIKSHPDVIADCAHNEASARALAQTLIDTYPYRRVLLVLGVSQDKDVAAICTQLKDSASEIILTKVDHLRAHAFNEEEAGRYFQQKPWVITADIGQALDLAMKKAQGDDIILVTGSVFVVAQAMEILCTNTKV